MCQQEQELQQCKLEDYDCEAMIHKCIYMFFYLLIYHTKQGRIFAQQFRLENPCTVFRKHLFRFAYQTEHSSPDSLPASEEL